jgi:predicted metal-binding membrane protein
VLPLLQRFDRVVAQRTDRGRVLGLVIAGYVLAWLGFGVAAHLLDAGLHEAALQSDWLLVNGWIVGSLVLTGAGLFQFIRLKNH